MSDPKVDFGRCETCGGQLRAATAASATLCKLCALGRAALDGVTMTSAANDSNEERGREAFVRAMQELASAK